MSGVQEIADDNKHAHLKGNLQVIMLEDDDQINSHSGGDKVKVGPTNYWWVPGSGPPTLRAISSTVVDKNNPNRGIVGEETTLDVQHKKGSEESQISCTLNWDVDVLGVPGAIIVKNNYRLTALYLKNITIYIPKWGDIVFLCNSWVYPQSYYHYDRVFFANHTYLPSKMPAPLKPYRDDELRNLRGDDQHGPYKEYHRVYRYDVYNDLGNPDGGSELERPTLGGSKVYPYPRRCRTGRDPMTKDTSCESWVKRAPLQLRCPDIYVPCDERFSGPKSDEFQTNAIQTALHGVSQVLKDWLHLRKADEFHSFEEIISIFTGSSRRAANPAMQQAPVVNPALEELLKQMQEQRQKEMQMYSTASHLNNDGDHGLLCASIPATHITFRYPRPQIIKEDEKAWMSDDEFAREMLAGVNPMMIKRLTEFPPKSTLDHSKYGDHTSTITEEHIQSNLEGLTVQEALQINRLYILDHHDNFMPFLIKVNKIEGNFIYATRTLLFLRSNGTLTPVAIELSEPILVDGITTAKSTVYTPKPMSATDADAWVWQLAKAYVSVNDYFWHQGISHWLHTHAVMEPFVIATHRQLSVTHPVHKLLHPHYRDTMKINALARQSLIQADGIFELTVFAGKYSFGITSEVYESWNFTEQALPNDLIKRGMAVEVEDESSPHKKQLRLLIEDYPYASDGLAIWNAIEKWVEKYLAIYYTNDDVVKSDEELQAWWKEVREVGHGDLQKKPWWPKMQTVAELTRTCSTIIWIASALHAAVNFGQFPYCAWYPNRPSISRKPMPDKKELQGSNRLEELFLKRITRMPQALIGISLVELLSTQYSDEVYLGQRDNPEWTSDKDAKAAFEAFADSLKKIEEELDAKNRNDQLHNRKGPVKFPYTLLFPNTSGKKITGITARGIPNSVSI